MANLITNTGSNSGNTTGWSAVNSTSGIVLASDNYFKFGGTSFQTGAWHYAWTGSLSLASGTKYYIEFNVKGLSDTATVSDLFMRVALTNQSTQAIHWLDEIRSISYYNGRFYAEFTAPSTHSYALRIYGGRNSDGTTPTNLYPHEMFFGDVWLANESYNTANPTNQPPVSDAGDDVTVALNDSGEAVIYLANYGMDDQWPGTTLTVSWSKVSGPTGLTIALHDANNYKATFTEAGTYVLRKSVSDGEYTDTDDKTVTVNAASVPAEPEPEPTPDSIKPQGTNLVNQSVATQGLSDWQVGWSTSMFTSGFDWNADGGEWFHLYRRGDSGQETRTYYFKNTQTIAVTAGTVYTFYAETQQTIDFTITPNTGGAVSRSLSVGENKWSWTAPTGVTSITVSLSMNVGVYTHVRFRNIYVGAYVPNTNDTGTPPPPPANDESTYTPFDIRLHVEDLTAPDGLQNLVLNPSGREGAFGWSSNTTGPIVTTTGSGDWTFLNFEAFTQEATFYSNDFMEVTPSWYAGIRILWGGFSAATRIGVALDYFDGAQAAVGSTSVEIVDPNAANEYKRVVQMPANAEYAKVRLTQYRDGGAGNYVNPFGGDYFEAREITVLIDSTIDAVDDIQSWQAESQISWVDVLGDSHEISIDREAMNSGLMSAVVIKDEYDPAIGGFLSPGAAVRVQVRTDNLWSNLFQGTVTNVKTTYPKGRTHIALTAADGMALLANQREPRGIYEIDHLPLILSDKGIKWSINGNANQVTTAPIASVNESASVLDQIVISRDSDKAYAWLDANNVLQVWNRENLPTSPVVTFTDVPYSDATYDSYSDIDVSFDTASCINVINITYVQADGTEVKYGPYVDAASLKKWGAYRSEFTLHGLAESESNMSVFASGVFANNANPVVKANTVRVPIKDDRGRTHAAQIDLYSLVKVIYSNRVNADYRVTGIKHDIRPDLWTVEYTFESGDSVAVPVWTPSSNG